MSQAIATTVIDGIQRRYAAGETLASIAKNEHVGPSTVRKYTKHLPRRVPGRHLNPETLGEVKDLSAQGLKQDAIARKLGISVTSVRKHQQASGIAPHRRGRPRKTAADIAR